MLPLDDDAGIRAVCLIPTLAFFLQVFRRIDIRHQTGDSFREGSWPAHDNGVPSAGHDQQFVSRFEPKSRARGTRNYDLILGRECDFAHTLRFIEKQSSRQSPASLIVIDLGSLEFVGVVDINRLPFREEINGRDRGFAVPVPGSFRAAEG